MQTEDKHLAVSQVEEGKVGGWRRRRRKHLIQNGKFIASTASISPIANFSIHLTDTSHPTHTQLEARRQFYSLSEIPFPSHSSFPSHKSFWLLSSLTRLLPSCLYPPGWPCIVAIKLNCDKDKFTSRPFLLPSHPPTQGLTCWTADWEESQENCRSSRQQAPPTAVAIH